MGHLVCVDPGGGVKEGVSAENGIIPLNRISWFTRFTVNTAFIRIE